jgi:hypothetical protein
VLLAAAAGQVRYGDEVIFRLAFTDGSIASGTTAVYSEYTPRIVMVRFSMKGNETEAAFFVTPRAAFKKSFGRLKSSKHHDISYYVFAHISGQSLQSYLGDFENDAGTFANALCEFELEIERPLGASGPVTTRVTTQPFLLRVSRDLIS